MNFDQFAPTDVSFPRLTDFFLSQLRQGETPSVESFAKAFPHLAKDIQAHFPALALMQTVESFAPTPERKVLRNQVLGGCKVQEEIGRGAMGIVYRAQQLELDRTVAIKVIPLHSAISKSIVERFQLERRAMARLDHPNIVPVYSYGHDDHFAFLVMKHIEGLSLYELLDGGGDFRAKVFLGELRHDWSALAKLGADVSAGLQHAHDQGLIHRDIKPGNLLLDKLGKVWITDFGLAKIFDYQRDLSRTGDAIGTPRYMSPEQLRGVCDPRSDVYSLGITLYELAAGERAWSDINSLNNTLNSPSLDLTDLRKINPKVPQGLAKIIMKASAFSADDRYQSCNEMQVVLSRFASGINQADRRRNKRVSDEIFKRRHRHNWYSAAGTAATVFLGLTLYLTSDFAGEAKKPAVIPNVQRTVVRDMKDDGLIERLAATEGGDMKSILHDAVIQSVEKTSDSFGLGNQVKQEITHQANYVFSELDSPRMNERSVEQFTESYRRSSLSEATRIVSITRIIERANFSVNEKAVANALVRRLSITVANQAIATTEAKAIVNQLTRGRPYAVRDSKTMVIQDKVLRVWLGQIDRRLSKIPSLTSQQELDIQREIDRLLADAERA